MPLTTITTTDGTRIYYKDWSTGQPVVFSHGWPLSADAWDDQMVFEEVTVPGSETPRWGRGRIWRRSSTSTTKVSIIQTEYDRRVNQWSDIRDHMPFLRQTVIDYTIPRGDVRRRGVSIVEIGVSTGNSTIALLAGILQLRRLGWDGELLRDGRH